MSKVAFKTAYILHNGTQTPEYKFREALELLLVLVRL